MVTLLPFVFELSSKNHRGGGGQNDPPPPTRAKVNWRTGFGWSDITDPGFRLTQCEESGVGLNGALPKVTNPNSYLKYVFAKD